MVSRRKWTCFDCDWDNDVSLSVCEMCDAARGLSCVARAEREDTATVAAKHRELAELQKLQEEERVEAEPWIDSNMLCEWIVMAYLVVSFE
jgi:hypothetical protein